MGPLFSSLLDLLRELDSSGIPLTIGGGFGLYLKRLHLERTGERTLFSILPAIRSTNDIDLFLRAEVLSDLTRTREVADAIRRLGYTPVEEAKFLQWKRPAALAGTTQEVKIDVLVGPLGPYRDRLKVSAPPRAAPGSDRVSRSHGRGGPPYRGSADPCTGRRPRVGRDPVSRHGLRARGIPVPHDEAPRVRRSEGGREQGPRPPSCPRHLRHRGDDDGGRIRACKKARR